MFSLPPTHARTHTLSRDTYRVHKVDGKFVIRLTNTETGKPEDVVLADGVISLEWVLSTPTDQHLFELPPVVNLTSLFLKCFCGVSLLLFRVLMAIVFDFDFSSLARFFFLNIYIYSIVCLIIIIISRAGQD